MDDGAARLRHNAGDVSRRPDHRPGRQSPVHPGRVPDDGSLVVADDRVFAVHGIRADLVRRVRPRFWARLHLCAAQSASVVGPTAPHSDQGTAIRALTRMLGGSIGIAILETQLTQNTQIVHSRLVEHLRPDNPLAQPPYLTPPFSLTDPSGIAALNHEVTRQAAMVAYNDDFALMLGVILASLPLLLLIRGPRRQPMPAAADD